MPKKSLSERTDLVKKPIRPEDDLSDKDFGEWKVLEYAGNKSKKYFKCQCSCGYIAIIEAAQLKNGRSTSCGHNGSSYKHGNAQHGLSPTYQSWKAMLSRCTNEKTLDFSHYGGRGIHVCERWLHSFETFLADMGERPSIKHTIERKDNDGHYAPENCIWATRLEQGRNKRNNVKAELHGKMYCIAELARMANLPHMTIKYRIVTLGWSAEKAITTPTRKKKES